MKEQSVNAWFSQRVVSVVPYPRKCTHLIIQVQSILSLFDVIYLMDFHLLKVLSCYTLALQRHEETGPSEANLNRHKNYEGKGANSSLKAKL